MVDENEIKTCTCDDSYDSHPCPFNEEINGDDSPCTCGEYCTEQCAQDI